MAENTSNTNNTEHTITAEQTNLPAEIDSGHSDKIKFHHLSPEKAENFDLYSDAFNNALENDNITNIAVTGPYASGKSSIIQACKEQYREEKFITLSLTNFTQENNSDKKEIEENLEAQLVNQLIHKIDKSKIQESKFLISHKIDSDIEIIKNKIYKNNKLILLLITSIVILSFNGDMFANTINLIEKYFSNYINIIFSIFEAVKLIAIFIIAGIVIKFFPSILYKIISLIKKNKFRRINLYGNEIELFTSDDTSIFDKHTDEILYLFENAGVNYFIFEDIDRYEDVTIFKKLREINILLNDKRKREKKPLIKFIYLICDNMFTAEERTKFFDFIIPVVPYIHKGNAYDYMAELFTDEIKDERNKKFLIKISLFIDNSRLLKNIANEYYIYNKFIHLKDREPYTKFIKLLSLIIYKNLFPKDFNLLYFNKGYLAELFNKEAFLKIVKLEDFTKYTVDNEYSIIGEENPDDCLIIFKEHIKDDITVAGILNRIYDKNIFYTAPKGYDYIYNGGYFDLIKFLIKNSYIDETYKDYMSEISENSLTYAERTFLQNIAAKNGKQFLTYLDRINKKTYLDNFLNFIDIEDLKKIEILNIYLLESIAYHYTIEGKKKFGIIYETILENLIFINTDYLFINCYYQYLISLYNITEYENNDIKTNHPYDSFIYTLIYNYKALINNNQIKDNVLSFVNVILNILIVFKNNFINPNDKIKKEIEAIKEDIASNKIYISALEKNLTDDIIFYYKNEHYKKNHLYDIYNIQENDNIQLSKEDMNKEKWLTQDILNILKEAGIYFNNINNISSIDFFKLVLNTQSFDVNYKNILYIAEIYNPDVNMQYIENVFDTLFIIQDKSLQKYIFSRFDNLIKTYFIIPKYNENIEKETYNKILESDFISIEHKKIFKNYFNSQE